MFNFNDLEIVHPDEPNCFRGSFVGIRKDKYLGRMAFTLPKGFDNFEKSYDNIKKLFFLMYRTFEKFRQNHEKNDEKPTSKDNTEVHNHKGAYVFTDEDNNETILYSKIDLIDKIFKAYKELEIESLIQELGLVEEVDYSKIDHYLDKGIYLKNNAIFIENMLGYRNIVHGVPSELIELFCYIYKELANELEKDVSEQIKEISFNFSYKYLSPEQSLFLEDSFDSTISILKDCLDNIHKKTAYKNCQYWDIYEAIEYFLYGSLKFDEDIDQGFWGINNFSYIWEDMCNFWMLQDRDYNILYIDTKLPVGVFRTNLHQENRIWIDDNLDNIFYVELHGIRRWMRPDVVTKHSNENKISGNPLISALNKRILSINKKEVPPLLSLDVNRINVDFIFSKNVAVQESIDSNFLEISRQIFDLFASKFSKLHRMKGARHTSLKGYTYSMRNKFHFTLKNIPKNIYEEVYQDVFNRGSNSKKIDEYFIVDWKYYSCVQINNAVYGCDERFNKSSIKSLLYEFCLRQIVDEPVISQFGVPYCDFKSDEIIISGRNLNCGIQVVCLNFPRIQEVYLNGDVSK